MEPKLAKWGIEYNMDGKKWSLDVMAADEADAMRRVNQAAAFGAVIGREVFSIPLGPSWLVEPLARWWFRGRS